MFSVLQPEFCLRNQLLAIVSFSICSLLLTLSHHATAQEEVPPLAKITAQPLDPFNAPERHVIRGMWFNLFAGKRLPQWRDVSGLNRTKLPANLDDHRLAAWRREAEKMESEKGFGVRRMLHQLQIKLRDGRFVYFIDRYSGNAEFRQVEIVFTYRGYDKRRRFYFVDWDWYENGGLTVISADTGLVWSLDGNTHPSPDGSRLLGFDNYGGPQQLTVLRLNVGNAIYEIEENGSPLISHIDSRKVNDLHWEDNTTIHLRRNLDTQVLLRRTDKGWRIEALSEPIQETISCSWSWSSNIGFPDIPPERICSVPDTPIPQSYVYTIRDPVHGRVNPDWLCIFEGRHC